MSSKDLQLFNFKAKNKILAEIQIHNLDKKSL